MCYRNGTGYRCECCGKDRVELRIIPYDPDEFSEKEIDFIESLCSKEECDSDNSRKSQEPVLMIAVTPGEPMKIITALEMDEYFPEFEFEQDLAELPELGLMMSYLEKGVFQVGERYYLDLPFLIYNLDDHGQYVSLTGEEMYAVQEFLTRRTVLVRQDGDEMPVVDLT